MRPVPVEASARERSSDEADSARPGLLVDNARPRVTVRRPPPLGADRAGRLMDRAQQGHCVIGTPEAACVFRAVIEPEIDREAAPSEVAATVVTVGVSTH